jgi:hypothetical protein
MGNRESLVAFHDMLSAIEGRIKPLIASGATVAAILASAPTAHFDGLWGRGYCTGDIFVRMILAGVGLTEEPKETSTSHNHLSGGGGWTC